MESLPVDIRFGKLILLGHAFGYLRECIILAAAFSTKPIFIPKTKSYLEFYRFEFLLFVEYQKKTEIFIFKN